MIEVAAVIGIKAGLVVCYGCLLGIGFWAGKQITNKLDEKLMLYDRKALLKFKNEMSSFVTT